LSTKPLVQNSPAVRPLPRDGSQTELRICNLVWIAALCILAIGPGSIGYTRSVDLGETLVAGMFLRAIARREAKRTPLDLIAAVWLCSQLTATMWGYRMGWGNHSPYPADLYAGGIYGPIRLLVDTLASFMAAYTFIWSGASTERPIAATRRSAPVLAAAAGVAVLCAIEQTRNMVWGTSDPRIQSTFTNPNLLGAFLCIALPVAASALLLPAIGRGLRIATATLSALLAAALVLTQSRGAFLGCAIGLIYIGAAAWAQRAGSDEERRVRGTNAVRAIVVCCVATVACSLMIFPHVLHQSRGVSDDQRRTAWIAAAIIIRSQPLTGIGIDGFPAAMAAMRLRELNPETPNGLPMVPAMHLHAHDLLLQAWVERGLVGAVSVVLLGLFVLRKARRVLGAASGKFDSVVVGAIGAMLATLAQNVTDYTFWYAPVSILFWIMAGLVFVPE
jgi:O-antigen ligase